MTENQKPTIKKESREQVPGGLSAAQLKLMAIIAMFIDHIAWSFVPTQSALGQIMHAVGRFTFPVMAFFIAEGFYYTKNLKRYFLRLALFALVSHFAFQYFMFGRIPMLEPYPGDTFLTFTYTSVLYPFALGLLCLWAHKTWQAPPVIRYSLILALCILAYSGDYMYFGPALILTFGVWHGDLKEQVRNGLFVIAFLIIMTLQSNWPGSIFMVATVVPLWFLRYYNGTQGVSRNFFIKYAFYIFYPLHLFILGYMRHELAIGLLF